MTEELSRTTKPPPPGVEALDDRVAAPLVPQRDARGHKGSFGTLVAVAGSLDYLGAGLLVALAAARAGAGLVCLAVPASLQRLVAGRVPEAVTLGLPELADGEVDAAAAVDAIAGRAPDALVVGSGLRSGDGTAALVRAIVAGDGAPVVLDAEGLNTLARTPDWPDTARRSAVLTPHPGEFARLEGGLLGHVAPDLPDEDAARAARASECARRTGRVIVLKGAHTMVAAPDGRVARASWENPALASAGTGDVLAGTIGSFLAQGLAPYDAARLGVHLHGAAGDAIRQRVGDAGLLASELPVEIAYARRRLAAVRERITRGARIGFGQRADR